MGKRTLTRNILKGSVWHRAIAAATLAAIVMSVCTSRGTFAGEAQHSLAARWTQIGAAGGVAVFSLALDPASTGRIYAGTYFKGLYVTQNGGGSWANPLPASIAAIAVNSHTPSTVYAGTWYSGTLKSSNNGVNWAPVNTGLAANDVYALAIDPVISTALYAGTETGVFKSTNGGNSWQAASSGFTGRNVYALAFCDRALLAGSDAGVFTSTNGGASWKAANSGLVVNEVYALAVTRGTVFAGTDQGVYRSDNCAADWKRAGDSELGAVVTLAVSPQNAWVVFAGTDTGVLVSYNAGATWAASNDGLSGWARQVYALSLDSDMDSGTLFAGTGSGVWQMGVSMPTVYGSYLPVVRR
jgi:ligand-binding sensor domain-containing protein